MKSYDYFSPKTVSETLEILENASEDTHIVAGGTDIVINIKRGIVNPNEVVNINKLQELKYVKCEDGLVKIGSLMNFSEIERNEILNDKAKVLVDACKEVGSTQIRNLGTIGGNIVNASAAGDSITALMALDASVVLKSSNEERVMKLEDFYKGKGNSQIRKDELLTEIFFEIPSDNASTGFVKLGARKALAIVIISIGALIEKDSDNICKKAQISVGAISRYPVRITEVEELLLGKELNEQNIENCIERLSQITDLSVSNSPFADLAIYKKHSIKGIAKEMFAKILSDLN